MFFEKAPNTGIDGGSVGFLVTWPWPIPQIPTHFFHFLPRYRGGINPQSINDFSGIGPIFPCGSTSSNPSLNALITSFFQKLRCSSERNSELSFCSVLGELSDWLLGVVVEVDGDGNWDEVEKKSRSVLSELEARPSREVERDEDPGSPSGAGSSGAGVTGTPELEAPESAPAGFIIIHVEAIPPMARK